MSTWQYRLYGLSMRSNRPIPGLVADDPQTPPDVHVWLNAPATGLREILALPQTSIYASPERDADGNPVLTIWQMGARGFYRLVTRYGLQFVVDQPGTQVWATWPEQQDLEPAAVSILLGPLAGIVLSLRGSTCIHASAIAMAGHAVALAGTSGAGKSTTAAALAARGHALLTDDLVVLAEQGDDLLVQPGCPRVNFWPSTGSLLGQPVLPLTPVVPGWEKGYLLLQDVGYPFHSHALPLLAIYLVELEAAGSGPATLEPLLPAHGLAELLLLASTPFQLLGFAGRLQEFQGFGQVVERIPVSRVWAGKGLRGVGALCRTIEDDVARLLASGPEARRDP